MKDQPRAEHLAFDLAEAAAAMDRFKEKMVATGRNYSQVADIEGLMEALSVALLKEIEAA